jgi:hypothetical protein
MRREDTAMWYRALGCIVALTVSLLAAPLEVDAQPSAKVATIGYLSILGALRGALVYGLPGRVDGQLDPSSGSSI